MKKKYIFSVPVIFIFIVLIVLFNSCDDNPVIQKIEGFDSARYNVTRKNVMYGQYSYIIDSNNIFLGDLYNFIYMKDTSINYMNFGDDFMCENIGGRDNEIYFVGGSFYNNSFNFKPRLKKWLGSGFEEITIVDTTDKNYYLKTAFISTNYGLFLGGTKGNILRYYNGNFTKYKFDSAFYECQFFQYEQNNLYSWEYRDSLPSGVNYFKEWQYFSSL